MRRQVLVTTLLCLFAFAARGAAAPVPPQEVRPTMPTDAPPRKVVVGTMMQSFWGLDQSLDERLAMLAGFVDRMGAAAKQQYGKRLDLGVITEYAVTGEARDLATGAVPLEGKVLEVMGSAARRNDSYVIFGLILKDDAAHGPYSNAAVLLDRQGKLVGIYRKVHAVADMGKDTCENGVTPGKEFPVYDVDFGRIAIATCFDMSFGDVWQAYRKKGAELVAWPSQSPQTVQPRGRALENQLYIVSSTWKNNASVFDPLGEIVAQTAEPGSVLVTQLDLTYALLGWQPTLEEGKLLQDKYGAAVGYRYGAAEDCGIFWSNDPELPIMQMVRECGLELQSECFARNLRTEQKVRGGLPKAD